MKLADHVKQIKDSIHKAFDNQFARLGIGVKGLSVLSIIPESQKPKREKITTLIDNHKDESGEHICTWEFSLTGWWQQ